LTVPSYAAAKHAIVGLTRALANEWAAHQINVNAIAPGYFATDMTDALQKDTDRNSAIMTRIPAGLWGNPEQLAGAVVYLASEASSYVHGHTLAVDGGWLSR
jgi:2-deoxy-D-gluconate 3-dehydrogenase